MSRVITAALSSLTVFLIVLYNLAPNAFNLLVGLVVGIVTASVFGVLLIAYWAMRDKIAAYQTSIVVSLENGRREAALTDRMWLENDHMRIQGEDARSGSPNYLAKVAGQEVKTITASSQKMLPEPGVTDNKGLPVKVLFEEYVDPTSVDIRNIFLGITYENKPIYVDFRKLIHLIIAGTTGSGKSVFLKNLLTQVLMSRPKVDVDLVDLGSQTFTNFDLPYARTLDEAEQIFDTWNQELERRRLLFERTRTPEGYGIEDLDDYNLTTGHNLPYSVLVVEEGAELLRQSELIETSVRTLVAQARKFGLAMVFVSQSSKASTMDTDIRGNFRARFQFPVEEKSLAKILIPDTNPAVLDNLGRAYMAAGLTNDGSAQRHVIQTPWLEKKTMYDAGRGWLSESLPTPVTPIDETHIIDLSSVSIEVKKPEEPKWEIVNGLPMIPNRFGKNRERIRKFFSVCQDQEIDISRLTKKEVLEHLGISIGGANYSLYDTILQEFHE